MAPNTTPAPPNGSKQPPYFLSVKQAAAIIQMTPNFLYDAIRDGNGPPFRRFGSSTRARIRLRYSDFIKWAESQIK